MTRWPLIYHLAQLPSEKNLIQYRPPGCVNPGKDKTASKIGQGLVNRLGQRSQLAAPGYADSTKLGTAFIYYVRTLYEVH